MGRDWEEKKAGKRDWEPLLWTLIDFRLIRYTFTIPQNRQIYDCREKCLGVLMLQLIDLLLTFHVSISFFKEPLSSAPFNFNVGISQTKYAFLCAPTLIQGDGERTSLERRNSNLPVTFLNNTFVCSLLLSPQPHTLATILDKINGKPRSPLPQIKDRKMARFCPSRGFILDLGGRGGRGMGVCCSILFCPRL